MVDVVSPTDRSRMMAGIKGKNSQPELLVRRLLFASGYRFRLHRRLGAQHPTDAGHISNRRCNSPHPRFLESH